MDASRVRDVEALAKALQGQGDHVLAVVALIGDDAALSEPQLSLETEGGGGDAGGDGQRNTQEL